MQLRQYAAYTTPSNRLCAHSLVTPCRDQSSAHVIDQLTACADVNLKFTMCSVKALLLSVALMLNVTCHATGPLFPLQTEPHFGKQVRMRPIV